VQSSSIWLAMISVVCGRGRPRRNEYFVRTHLNARTGILADALSTFGDDPPSSFPIVLIGNQIADSARLPAISVPQLS
jgi:hypothetical protein